MNPERFKPVMLRDKLFLKEIYLSPSVPNTRRLLNFGSDQKLNTLIKVLHLVAVGEIKLKREHSNEITTKSVRALHKHFETKVGLKRLINMERAEKLKLLSSIAPCLTYFLFPLFNE